MTRRRGVAFALAVITLLSAAACGGDEGDDAEVDDTTSTSSLNPSPSSSSSTPAPSSSTPAPASVGPPSTGAPGATTSTTRPRSTPTAPTTSVPADGTDPVGGGVGGGQAAAAPGRYSYTTAGTFTGPIGGTQRRDGETVLVVDPLAQGRQHSRRQGPGGRAVDQTLELRPDGAYATAVTIVESGFSQEVRPSPPVLALPSPAPVGRIWSWRTTTVDGRSTVDSSFKVVRTEAVPVGGESVAASVIEATITTTGEITSTGRQTLWFAPASGLIVKQQETTTGRFGVISFSSESTDILRSLRPA